MRLPLLNKQERRRWRRQWFNGSVQVSNGTHSIDGLGITLSNGGMYLFAMANLQVGSEVKLRFIPPSSKERVELFGQVRHRTVYLYGIEFLTEASTNLLDAESKPFDSLSSA